MTCCDYSPRDECDIVLDLPRQYRNATNLKNILGAWYESTLDIYNGLGIICGAQDCSNLTGDALTAYGETVGFPRAHCDVECGNSGIYTINDDELYCKFIRAHLISRSGNTISALCEAIEVLFGPEAFIISSQGGKTRVSSGRPLLAKERSIIELYRRFLPHSCATKMEIYEITSLSGLFGINCGSCMSYQGPCSTARILCNQASCETISQDIYSTSGITRDVLGYSLDDPSEITLCDVTLSQFSVEFGPNDADGNETFSKFIISTSVIKEKEFFYAIRFGPLAVLPESSFFYTLNGSSFWEWDISNLSSEDNLEIVEIMKKIKPLIVLKEC